MKKIFKRGMSGLLAVLMAFTVLAGFGTTTAFAASETFEKLFSRMDVQRRMFVCMERTQADISRTAALQRHIGSHHFLDRGHPKDSLFQRIASHNNRFS